MDSKDWPKWLQRVSCYNNSILFLSVYDRFLPEHRHCYHMTDKGYTIVLMSGLFEFIQCPDCDEQVFQTFHMPKFIHSTYSLEEANKIFDLEEKRLISDASD